ncbi:MAG: YdcF family protein [Alphaproteobacteria bacterium]|nr:YdcF family protein [Alphaproteobacteria bacterium]
MRRLRRFVMLLGVLAVVWLLGLFWFANQIPNAVDDPTTRTDAIVVLTGGSLRVENGLQLLAAGMGKTLFVTGVFPGVSVPALLHSANAPDTLACCIVLGHVADNTTGNAIETAAFMRKQNYHSLRLVTSAYHMPRSLLEFARAMPGVTIVPNPVFAGNVKQGQWWEWPGTLSLIVTEYVKYLAAIVRPWVIGEAQGGAAHA